MKPTTGSLRSAPSGNALSGDAAYGAVTALLAERYAIAAAARPARAGRAAGPSLRLRVGRGIVALGTVVGGRGLMPPTTTARPSRAVRPAPPAAIHAHGPGTAGGC